MLDRRKFLSSFAAGAAAFALKPKDAFSRAANDTSPYFGVHPFIEANPDAVFILLTTVDVKTNSAAKKQTGLSFGSSVFVPMSVPGVPVTSRVAIKPNIAMMPAPLPEYMGIVTDAYFVEGVIESLKSLGMAGSQFYIREVNSPDQFVNSGYTDMATRTGADLRDLSAPIGTIPESDIQWIDVPEGTWFKRIPFLWPVNDPETFLLNIAKFKTHSMGMTLCAKNLQGADASRYVTHCTPYGSDMGIAAGDIQPGAQERILADYTRHYLAQIPRWDRPGSSGGLWQETWAARCIDNNSVTHAGLHIIEAIYGREGAFTAGPGPEGEAVDHMTNMVIFGKNAFHVDIVGHWLGGHEPGDFGLFHIARERGLSNFLNPYDIPIFEWKTDGSAQLKPIYEFPRTVLLTQYLRRDYNGQTEDDWHRVNEPYSYPDSASANVPVESGWNLISVPLIAVDSRVSALFPGATSPAYAFDGSYEVAAQLQPGTGYWLKFPSAGTVAVSGTQPSIRRIPVKEGWNIIGPLESAVATDAILSDPSGIITSPFYGFANGYAIASVLESGKAYWVKTSAVGELRIPAETGLGRIRQSVIDESWIHIDVRDAGGHRMVLHLTDQQRMPQFSALPPLPPTGVFDVRFRGDTYIEAMGHSHEIVVHSATYPLEVRATNLKGITLRVSDGLGANLLSSVMKEGEDVAVSMPLSLFAIDESGALPTSFGLEQNWPNPFNPTTTIRFSLPLHSRVSLVVYNILGQRIREVVNEELPAGTHQVQFHARDLPSGEYLYRLNAGTFTESKRMMLVR